MVEGENKDAAVSTLDLQRVKQALQDADLEIYRTQGDTIHLAERVRLHIMDSGVRVHVDEGAIVQFTARSQRSDFPQSPPEELFEKVRESIGKPAVQRGYEERDAGTVEVKDPVDDSKVLDVWHEVTYGKRTHQLDETVEEVRWALQVEKYVTS
jgi:hypothetical protein